MNYIKALVDADPKLIVPDVSIDTPDYRSMACSQSWAHVPDFGPSSVLFDQISGFLPWFGILSGSSGLLLRFYYPRTVQKGALINVGYYADQVIPNGFIDWVHGDSGLAEGQCFDIMVLWAMAIANRQQRKPEALITLKGYL